MVSSSDSNLYLDRLGYNFFQDTFKKFIPFHKHCFIVAYGDKQIDACQKWADQARSIRLGCRMGFGTEFER